MSNMPQPSSSSGSNIFLNYRREDSEVYAHLLHQELLKHFSSDQIFFDRIAIPLGADFVKTIEAAVGSCAAFVSLIGNRWLTVSDEKGRRLDNPSDRLRLEIAAALKRDVRIIPVLVGGATMPREEDLPEDIASLARKNALIVSDPSWKYHFGLLISALNEELAGKSIPEPEQKKHAESSERRRTSKPEPYISGLQPMFRHWARQLMHKGVRYWLVVTVLIAAGMLLGHWLDHQEVGMAARFKMYQMLQIFSPRAPRVHRTSLVLIGDDEYRGRELNGRFPIRRDYLAKLVRGVSAANPGVIALAFDFRSPKPDSSVVGYDDYPAETRELLSAVRDVSRKCTVVLPQTLGIDDQGNYVLESDIYNGFDFAGGDVRTGYPALPYDVRRIPLTIQTKNGVAVSSFSEAIVRAVEPDALLEIRDTDTLPPFASYLTAENFESVSADEVLNGDPRNLYRRLAHKVVIVGGVWHSQAYRRGPVVDAHLTPVGSVAGIFIHANYVEAILDGRTYKPLGKAFVLSIEILFLVVIALFFVLDIRPRYKYLILYLQMVFLVVFSYFSWRAFDTLFNFFIPAALLLGHFTLEQIIEWRTLAQAKRSVAHS